MYEYRLLDKFFNSIQDKPCIGATHVCLYMGLLSFFVRNEFRNPIQITRAEVMKTVKIGGIATYHKCMKDLEISGYITYRPSFHPGIRSRVDLNITD